MDDGDKKWRVDERLLHQVSKKSEPTKEVFDLPAKKDFVKRARHIIQKTMIRLVPDGTNGKMLPPPKAVEADSKSSESHGYIVIDQGNHCSILLAEMVRALMKGTTRVLASMRTMVSYMCFVSQPVVLVIPREA